jgi:copper homeostasis protein
MLMHVFDSPRNTELYAAEPSDVGCSREREVMLLEVIACSVRDAIEAQRGGAGRLELVRALGRGGLTPSLDLVEDVLRTVTIPVRVMIRESDGYLAGTAAEIDRLAHLAERSASLGANGVVVGFLRRGKLDDDALDEVLAASNGVGATFHRALTACPIRSKRFASCNDGRRSIESCRRAGPEHGPTARRVSANGAEQSPPSGCSQAAASIATRSGSSRTRA